MKINIKRHSRAGGNPEAAFAACPPARRRSYENDEQIFMRTIPLSDLIQLHHPPKNDAAFVIAINKSTFIQVAENGGLSSPENFFGASPTPLCGDSAHQYNPCFVMAVLSVTPFPNDLEIETFNQIQLPKVLFNTHPDIRRSMTLNAMRMSTELFAAGSERVFQLAKQRLEANQPDVVHDLLVYLMHAILDARRDFAQEKTLRAESIAAYLGISPTKVLLLFHEHDDNIRQLAESLEQGQAGILRRKLNVASLVSNQMELLTPYEQSAFKEEINIKNIISKVMELWKSC